MSKRYADDDFGGFKVLEMRKENFQHDFLQVGQGFPIEVHRVDGGKDKPDTYVATAFDGRYKAEAKDEADAVTALRANLTDLSLRGEL